MKIIHLANHTESIGNGIVNVMVDLACEQSRAGHDVVVATSGGSFEPLLKRHGVRHVTLAQSKQLWRLPSMILGFRRLVDSVDPDLVHAHMMTGALIARLGRLRRRYALVTTVHNEFQKSATLMRVGDRVVGVSRAVSEAMIQRGVAPRRMSTVLNGTIGSPRFASIERPAAISLAHPNVVCVAGLFLRKGIVELLRAFAMARASDADSPLSGSMLYIVGEGPDRAIMESLARELGIRSAVKFVGFLPDPRAYLDEADVFVLASHADPCPLVISEAREAGCAVIGTQVGGIPEMLEQGAAGVLVPAQDAQALADKLRWLLVDTAARNDYRERALRNVSMFSLERVCSEYMAVYEQAIEERSPAGNRSAVGKASAG